MKIYVETFIYILTSKNKDGTTSKRILAAFSVGKHFLNPKYHT